jgi:CubicO group peptidase (beta-lactamase class C family)
MDFQWYGSPRATKALSMINPAAVLLAFSLFCGGTVAFAEPMHTPTKMPMAKAESVGMSTEGLKHIDEIMQEYIDAGTIQGGITVVARRGKVVHFSTHGDMDVKKGRAMEADAIFRMASSTKAVTGVAAMMMIQEGLISPSDPVSKYIPEFADMKVAIPVSNADSKAKTKNKAKAKGKDTGATPAHRLVPVDTPVTIHHLLTHTAGLRSGGLGTKVDQVEPATGDQTLATYIPRLAKVPLDFQPGTQRRYSPTTGLDVVARIIEIVSETPFDEFLQARIFNPLGMNSAYFRVPDDMKSKVVVVADTGASGKKNKKKKIVAGPLRYVSASAGLSSTAEDYLHFQQMLLNYGELFGHQVLSPMAVKMMSSNQVGDIDLTSDPKSRKGLGHGYTVGVTLDSKLAANYRGNGAFGGGGAFGTMSWTDPENELVAIIMLQQPRGGMQTAFAKAIQQAIVN